MQRRTIVLLAAVLVTVGVGAGAAVLLASGDEPATSSVSTSTTTPPPADARAKDTFLKVLRDQNVVRGPADEQIVYAEGDMYCRYLTDGLTTAQLMDNAGAAGTPERAKSERVLSAAAQVLCPQHAPKLMPQPSNQP